MTHLPIVKTTTWDDEQATQAFAQRLASLPALRESFISLQGDLGVGKTALVRHLLRACGVSGRIKSPTYALVESYELDDWAIWHFDFYRFVDANEWIEAGFRDVFTSPGLKLVEWPEKAGLLLPEPDLELHLQMQDGERRAVELVARTPRGLQMLSALSTQDDP